MNVTDNRHVRPDAVAPGVSVVIPAFNAGATIERALDSVGAQTCDGIAEVIVVDDGSTDGTSDIVREKYPHVILVEQENAGVSAARNAGAIRANCEWVAFLDADDEWLPQKLEVQMEFAAACPGAALLLCEEITVPVGGAPQERPGRAGLTQYTFRDWLTGRAVRAGASLSCSGWLMRRACFDALSGFDETLGNCEDFELALRTAASGYVTAAIPRGLFLKHMQVESVSQGPRSQIRRAEAACRVVRTYDPDNVGNGQALLAEDEYPQVLRFYLTHLLYHLLRGGEEHRAVEVADELRRMRGGRTRSALAGLVCRWPGVSGAAVRRVLHPLRSIRRS
ncbi:MAG: glycosyltransferase family A protein [Armatimonadota bacterium]